MYDHGMIIRLDNLIWSQNFIDIKQTKTVLKSSHIYFDLMQVQSNQKYLYNNKSKQIFEFVYQCSELNDQINEEYSIKFC